MKARLLVACVVLVATGTSACTDDPAESEPAGPPTEAEFCSAFQDFYDELGAFAGDEVADYVERLKDSASLLGDLGVPDDMSAAAESGLEFYLVSVEDLADDATLADIGKLIDRAVTEEQQHNADALQQYLDATCPGLGIAG